MAENRTDDIIDAGHERDGHVRHHAGQNVGRQLLLDSHPLDLEVMIVLAVIRDVERHDASRKRRRHVDVVFIFGNADDRAIHGLRIALAVRGVL